MPEVVEKAGLVIVAVDWSRLTLTSRVSVARAEILKSEITAKLNENNSRCIMVEKNGLGFMKEVIFTVQRLLKILSLFERRARSSC